MTKPHYGQIAKLVQQVCQEFPLELSIALLTNEVLHRLRLLGVEALRDSVNKALSLHLKDQGRTWDSVHNNCERPDGGGVAQPTATVKNELPGDETSWRIDDEHYTWESKATGRVFRRRVIDVDQMFFAYSQHGRNLSQVQMMHDFGLTSWEWNTLKVRLMLQKLSNVFSPYTVSITPKADLEAMMEQKMNQRYEAQGPLIERAHRNAAVKELNKVLLQNEQRDARQQRLALELADLLPAVRYRYVARAPRATNGPEHLVVTVADPHVGAQVKRLLNAPVYNHEVLYQYADQLIARVNARGAARVYIAGLGDYIESFQGCNHPNSWMQLDADKTRAGGIRAALDFFSYLVEGIYNVAEIWGVSGNHDRTSNDKKEDSRGEAAELLFMVLSERYAKAGIAVIYRYDLLVRVVDKICYMLGHSHLGMLQNEKKALETIARHRVPGLYCVVLSAHLHSRITKLDGDDCRWVFSPSFFTGNDYSSDGGWSTLAGFLTLENSGRGYPRIVDEPLNIEGFDAMKKQRFEHANAA